MSQTPPPRPLEGRRVLDLGTALAGPVCATILAEFGADVVKIERPGSGDTLRSYGPKVSGVPLWWMIEARNKRSVTLDVSVPRGQEIIRRLAVVSDVLVENFRPGTMERWGLGPAALREVNPDLVYVSVSGFGQTGPYSARPAYDRIAQAMAGLTYLTGHADSPPVRPGIGITDYTSGVFAALGAVLALYGRDAGGYGRGQQVDVALYESLLRMYHYHLPLYERTGHVPERMGNVGEAMVPAECFRSSDGVWLMVAVGSEGTFAALAEAMNRPDLVTDERFRTNERRVDHIAEIHGEIAAWVDGLAGDEARARLEEAGVPVAPLYTARDIYEDEHFRSRGSVTQVEDEQLGSVTVQGIVPRLVDTPGRIEHTGPRLGQHTAEVLVSLLGMDLGDIDRLRADGVV